MFEATVTDIIELEPTVYWVLCDGEKKKWDIDLADPMDCVEVLQSQFPGGRAFRLGGSLSADKTGGRRA